MPKVKSIDINFQFIHLFCASLTRSILFYEHLFIFLFAEGSSHEYREKKDKEIEHESSSSESDNDDDAAECGGGVQSSGNTKPPSHKSRMDYINQYFERIGLTVDKHNQILKTVDFDGLINHWNEHGFKKIVTMVGAGISTCMFSGNFLNSTISIVLCMRIISIFSGWHTRFSITKNWPLSQLTKV